LSGGQRQRIAIARAVIRNPSVLLLDEATSALDQTTEAAINRTLLKLAAGRTMIWSTHRLTSVVEMDEIIVISAGKAIERGSHAELLAANGVYRRLWDDQGHKSHAAAGQADDNNEDDDEDEDDGEGASSGTRVPMTFFESSSRSIFCLRVIARVVARGHAFRKTGTRPSVVGRGHAFRIMH